MFFWLGTWWRCWLALKDPIVWKTHILHHNKHSQWVNMLSFWEGPREHQFSPLGHLTPGHLPQAQYIFSGVKCISAEMSWYPFTKSHPCFKTFPWDNSQARLVLFTSITKQHWTFPNCRRTANQTDVKLVFYKFSLGTYYLLPETELITGTRKGQEQPNTGRETGSQRVLPTLSVHFAFWAWAHGCDFLLQPYNTVIFSASKIVPVSYNRIKLINISWYCNNNKKTFLGAPCSAPPPTIIHMHTMV